MEQHADLKRRTGQILALLATPVDWAELERELAELHELLHVHFAEEASGGYMAAVSRRLPHRQARIHELGQTHPRLDDLLVAIREASRARQPVQDLADGFQRWRIELLSHELDELRLVEEAFGTIPT